MNIWLQEFYETKMESFVSMSWNVENSANQKEKSCEYDLHDVWMNHICENNASQFTWFN